MRSLATNEIEDNWHGSATTEVNINTTKLIRI